LLTIVLVVSLAPILLSTVPPLHDYPFHLARSDILASLNASPFLQTYYQQGSFLLPNVGMDVAMIPLTHSMPILLAGRVFLGITLVIMLTGTVALHASLHGRLSVWPLVAAFFLYNWIFLYGFLNYLVGVGLMLWATAGWIALRPRHRIAALIWATVMSLVLLACHLVALGLFAVIIAGIELQRGLGTIRTDRAAAVRDLALAALPFVITLAVFAALSPTAQQVNEVITYFGARAWKPLVAYRTLLTTAGSSDLVMLAPLVAGVLWALWRRRLQFATPMATACVFLVLTFAAMPYTLFDSTFADMRLPIAILLVFIASTNMTGFSRRTQTIIAACALTLLIIRSATIAHAWRESDARFAPFISAYRLLPDGVTLYTATAGPNPSIVYRNAEGLALWHPPLKHVVSLASLGRDIFVPATWADPYKQPIRVTARGEASKTLQGNNPFDTPTSAELSAVIKRIGAVHAAGSPADHLLLLYPDRLKGELPAELSVVARGTDFVLLRLP